MSDYTYNLEAIDKTTVSEARVFLSKRTGHLAIAQPIVIVRGITQAIDLCIFAASQDDHCGWLITVHDQSTMLNKPFCKREFEDLGEL